MDDNVMRILQMLQDGKISAQEADMLIAALRGESKAPPAEKPGKEEKEDKLFGFDLKPPKIDLDNLGERISQAVSRVQPEKIVKRVQTQLRSATRAGAHWGSTVTQRVRTWTEGEDSRPVNPGGQPELAEAHEQDFHLDAGAFVMVENPLGDVRLVGVEENTATIIVRKIVWSARQEDLKATADRIQVDIHGTDSRLDIKVNMPEFFREGTVDIEMRVPRSVSSRVATHFGIIDIATVDGRTEAVSTTGDVSLHHLGGDVRAETASGDLSLEEIKGSGTVATQSGDIKARAIQRGLAAHTASGDVDVEEVEGGKVECKSVSGDVKVHRVGVNAPLDITVESVSGDAELEHASGNIALKAVSGDVKGEDLAATRIQAQTVSGDVTLKLREIFSGTMQLNTVSGDVTLVAQEGSNLRVVLSTTSGDLRCEHDAHEVTATETLWSGVIGTGAGTLNVQTISGDIRLQRA